MNDSSHPLHNVLERIATSLERLAGNAASDIKAKNLPTDEAAQSALPANFAEPARIIQYLAAHGFTVHRMPDHETLDPTLDTLAYLIGSQFRLCGRMIRAMREGLPNRPDFSFELLGQSKEDIGNLINICTLLRGIDFLKQFGYKQIERKIYGTVSCAPEAVRFISGVWLERCIRIYIHRFLNLDHAHIELLRNAAVQRPDGRSFEMDTVLWVNDQPYWLEAKSAGYLPDTLARYREVAESLKLPRDRCFLVLAEPPHESEWPSIHERSGFTVVPVEEMGRLVEDIEDRHQ